MPRAMLVTECELLGSHHFCVTLHVSMQARLYLSLSIYVVATNAWLASVDLPPLACCLCRITPTQSVTDLGLFFIGMQDAALRRAALRLGRIGPNMSHLERALVGIGFTHSA